MPNFMDLITQRLEIFRLEQRYTKRRNRRSTFVSEAAYVDGEYVYNIPSPTGSSTTSSTSSKISFAGKFGSMRGRSERGEPRPNGTDGKRGDVVRNAGGMVVIEERELVLSPVDDITEAQVIGKERERRWSGITGRRGLEKSKSMVAVREAIWEDDAELGGLRDH